MLETLYKVLITGNGEPSVCEQVRDNAKEIKYLKKVRSSGWLWMVRVITITTALGMLYLAFIK